MGAKPSARSARFSRRALLQGAVGAATIGAAVGPAAAETKLSKQSVAYVDQPNGGERCAVCAHFAPPGACRIVQGAISPQGYCRLFVPASQHG
jgi:hypothetical protein